VWFRKRKADPVAVMHDMREQVLTMSPLELGVVSGPGHLRIWSVLMETGYPEAVASLVTIADDTTSLHFSNGGGIIGAGQHAAVRSAANRFIALADSYADALAIAGEHPLPSVGRVRFYARAFDGLRTLEASVTELGENRHPLSPLFHAGHEVIAAVRAVSQYPPSEDGPR
jgi:hypothetical protein